MSFISRKCICLPSPRNVFPLVDILYSLQPADNINTDIFRLFGAKCDKCLRSFGKSDYVMRAKNKIFHLECFQCAACEKQLMPGNEYSLRHDELFCKDHSLEGSGGGLGGGASIVPPGLNGDLKKENPLENNNTILQHHNTSNSSEDNSEGKTANIFESGISLVYISIYL